MRWISVDDTRRICCEHVVHDVDTLWTGCQAVSVLYRIPHAYVIQAAHLYETINSLLEASRVCCGCPFILLCAE